MLLRAWATGGVGAWTLIVGGGLKRSIGTEL
jgi:hypothetical protein